MKGVLFIILFSLMFFGVLPTTTNAQPNIFSIEPADITMSFDPETPGTNEQVTVTVSSLITNLNRLRITWFINGEVIKTGIGETTLDFQTGIQGEVTTIDAYIQVDGQNTVRKWARVSPSDLDIVWQADTYTPPFYRGKALPTPESFIRVIGLPNVRNIGINNLEKSMVFNWDVNYENKPELSGFGRNPINIRNDFLRLEEVVELEVIHPDGLAEAKSSVTIPIVEPKLIIYSPLNYLKRANYVNLRNENSSTIKLTVEPFFFSVKRETINTMNINWFINANLVFEETSDRKNELFLNAPTESVASQISVRAELQSKPLQLTRPASLNMVR